MTFTRILFVGCGNMGGAMLDGWLAGGVAPGSFTIVSPNRSAAPEGVRLLREVPDEVFDMVIIGVKPQKLDQVVDAIRPVAAKGAVIVSILAGTMLDTLREVFPDAGAIVRLMPNLSCALGKSPIALVEDGLDAARKAELTEFVGPLGTAEWLDDETLFDLVTALAGSGPGFVYRFIDALAKGAVALGLPADQAERLAVATVDGASALAAASEHSAEELARRVASPGGMTQVGLDVMDKDDAILSLIENTLRGARDRGIQMAEEARKSG